MITLEDVIIAPGSQRFQLSIMGTRDMTAMGIADYEACIAMAHIRYEKDLRGKVCYYRVTQYLPDLDMVRVVEKYVNSDDILYPLDWSLLPVQELTIEEK